MRIPPARMLAFLALLALATFVEWHLIPVPGPARPSAASRDVWDLPQLDRPQTTKALEILVRTTPWGNLPEATEQEAFDRGWKILAIVARGQERSVVVKVGLQPERQLKVGDALPEGSTILEIHEDWLCILVQGKKRTLALYQKGSTI